MRPQLKLNLTKDLTSVTQLRKDTLPMTALFGQIIIIKGQVQLSLFKYLKYGY